jgi:membrane peptidoglycan carboxypeptidase
MAPRAASPALRRLRRAALALVLVAVGLVSAMFGCVVALRGVGDAGARMRNVLAAHDGTYGPLPLPAKLGDAVVSVEDEHFYSNFLVNVFAGVGRATLATLDASRDPGGSTIEQQLAKQLYGHGAGLAATLREIGLGVKLSLSYGHAQILNMYLNAVYYGHGYWGDVAAAQGYFGVAPRALDWAEAAMLAGLPQAPSLYDPVAHLALAKLRQQHVLDQLVVNRFLSRRVADAAFRQPLPLHRTTR